MNRLNAFIQARVGSSRLPKKVLKTINGLPVFVHIVQRLKQASCIDKIVLLTSMNPENDELCELASQYGVEYFRGSESNVLERFQFASAEHPSEFILRITGDTPFVEPAICDQLFQELVENNSDYAYLSEKFAEGVDCEIVKTSKLLSLNTKALRPSELEHVTLHFYENQSDLYRVHQMDNDSDDSHYRFTLDTIEDWYVIEKVAAEYPNSISVSYQEIKRYLDNNQKVKEINSKIIRNEGLLISLLNEKAEINDH